MAGEAKTAKFLLSEATLMVGPSADVFDLTPAAHSIGLVKNVRAEVTHGWVELMQGVTNQVVYSVNNSVESTISAEVYEYTGSNLAYGAQLDASDGSYDSLTTIMSLASEHDDADTTITVASGEGTNIAAGDFLVLQRDSGDTLGIVKIASILSDVATIAAGYGLPTGVVFPVATTRVFRVRKPIKVGESTDETIFGVKIVGILPDSKRPVTLIYPKVRIMKGLSLAFDSQNFANMPFEFKPYALLPTDAHYAELPSNKQFMVLPA